MQSHVSLINTKEFNQTDSDENVPCFFARPTYFLILA